MELQQSLPIICMERKQHDFQTFKFYWRHCLLSEFRMHNECNHHRILETAAIKLVDKSTSTIL